MPELSFDRNGSVITVHMDYYLSGSNPYTGDENINIGSNGVNDTANNAFSSYLHINSDFALKAGKTYAVDYEINDTNDGAHLTRSFSLTRFDDAANFHGSSGLDIVFGSEFGDQIYGESGRDFIAGMNGRDKLFGGNDQDRLDGGKNHDILTGGRGDDQFFFTAPIKDANSDTITDFDPFRETIWFDESVYYAIAQKGSAPQELYSGYFAKNTLGTAQDRNDHIIYETDTGELYYDSDGFGGAKGVLIAVLDKNLRMSADDFVTF